MMKPNCVQETLAITRTHPSVGVVLSTLEQFNARAGRLDRNYSFYPRSRYFAPGCEALSAMFMAAHVISRTTVRREVLDLDGYRRQIGRHIYSPLWLAGSVMKVPG